MSIDNMTIGEAKQIAAIFNQDKTTQTDGINFAIGEKCIVRTYSAGVWFGEIAEKSRNEVIVKNARRLWRWKTKESISLSAVAKTGVDADGCKFAPAVDCVWLEAIELIPCTEDAIKSIEAVEDVEVD